MSYFLSNEELSLGKDYKLYLGKKLGCGAFGVIYKGINTINEKNIAIKCEKIKKANTLLLKNETEILNYLQNGIGIPKLYNYIQTPKYNFMIFEFLGPNLNELYHLRDKNFSRNTILSLGLQMLNRIEFLHSRHIIHRDIKPENFLMGKGKKNSIVYICDFGLSKRFRDRKTGAHIPYKNGKKFTGTPCYASIYTHLGVEQSRRDDLESLAYILIYFSKGNLPWRGIKSKNKKEKYDKILTIKMNTNNTDLCADLPEEFSKFLQYSKDLHFEERPDYEYLKNLLKKMSVGGVDLCQVKLDFMNILQKSENNDCIEICKKEIKEDAINFNVSKKRTNTNSNNNSRK